MLLSLLVFFFLFCNLRVDSYDIMPPCCWFDICKTESQSLRCHMTHTQRLLLSVNVTESNYINDDDSNSNRNSNSNSDYNEMFFGRRFYGLPILVYFVFLFGFVCLVWICCIIALCVGYSKRRKAIRIKGENIRRKQLNAIQIDIEAQQSTKRVYYKKEPKSARVISTTVPVKKRSPKPNVILPIAPQRDINNTNTNKVILPTRNSLLSRTKAKQKAKPHLDEMSSTQKSYPSDNDIIQQMEQDWASENGTNIFDSANVLDLDLNNSQFNSINTTSKNNIPIIYAKHFGLNTTQHQHNMSGDTTTATTTAIDIIHDEEDEEEEDEDEIRIKSVHNIYNRDNYYYGNKGNKRPHTTRPKYYYYDADHDANSDPSYASSESVPLNIKMYKHHHNSRRSRRTQSDTSIDKNNYYTTNNNKNPFQMKEDVYDDDDRHHDGVYRVSLQQQIEMKHTHNNSEIQASSNSDLEQHIIKIDYRQYSQPISLPIHKHLSKDDSLRFPQESMPFNHAAAEEETETIEVHNPKIGIQITIEKPPYIADTSGESESHTRSTHNYNHHNKNKKTLSPVSNTPQPVSAPLSPKALSNTMPIRKLSEAKKSPFHLPPASISLQRIHSPDAVVINPLLTPPKSSSHTISTTKSSISKSNTNDNNMSSKSSQVIHHYSLDQSDLFDKLVKLENGDSDSSTFDS